MNLSDMLGDPDFMKKVETALEMLVAEGRLTRTVKKDGEIEYKAIRN